MKKFVFFAFLLSFICFVAFEFIGFVAFFLGTITKNNHSLMLISHLRDWPLEEVIINCFSLSELIKNNVLKGK